MDQQRKRNNKYNYVFLEQNKPNKKNKQEKKRKRKANNIMISFYIFNGSAQHKQHYTRAGKSKAGLLYKNEEGQMCPERISNTIYYYPAMDHAPGYFFMKIKRMIIHKMKLSEYSRYFTICHPNARSAAPPRLCPSQSFKIT